MSDSSKILCFVAALNLAFNATALASVLWIVQLSMIAEECLAAARAGVAFGVLLPAMDKPRSIGFALKI
jgi:hypothetical protein